MSQTNTNTGDGNVNQNHNTGKGGQSQGGSCGQGHGDCNGDHGKSSIANYSLEGKMKVGYLSKLIIIKSGHQATKYHNFIDALPGFCTYKNYKYINDIICTKTKLTEAIFLPVYPFTTQWSFKYYVNIGSVNPIVGLDIPSGARPTYTEMVEKSFLFNSNLMK